MNKTIIITLNIDDDGAKLVAASSSMLQNDVIEGKTAPEVLRKYADMLQRKSELSKIDAQEYARQELAKLTDLEIIMQHGKMSPVADYSKQYYGHDEHWAALFDAINTKLESMRPKKR